ncbi:MAG: hypothetical protein GY849_11390 [Deltaproteobacteria bacterium]|nr:hypothetical protein [Deltaproteobacteria bacterium]
MAEGVSEPKPAHYIAIDKTRCNGCVRCMKACSTKAIRVREGLARIEGVCIDCVECYRACPKGAIKILGTENTDLEDNSTYVVSPTSVLYSQFGEKFLPNDILLGLKQMDFGHVYDLSYTNEIFAFAVELYIRENRNTRDRPFPLISPICPVVGRLITYRFPLLLKHIPPLATPREIVTREIKKRLAEKTGGNPEDVSILHITPCPAMMLYIMESAAEKGSRDRAVGINHIFEALNRSMQDIRDDRVFHHSGGVGLGWGLSGGEIASINANCLAVSGLYDTLRYLEMVDMGKLNDIEYLEFRACKEGCIGGPFTVVDRYQTKRLVEKLVRMFGVEKRIKYQYVIKLYKEGWFSSDQAYAPWKATPHQLSSAEITERIERQKKVEKIMKSLPEKECGSCGSPDCRTFAEDVVDGRTSRESCFHFGE